jgi:hypothetical protein
MKKLAQFATVIFIFISAQMIAAQTTAFNYQGKLTDAGTPQAAYQMQFKLFDTETGGSQVGNTVENPAVAVSDGVFSVMLDFGTNAFSGANRYLEISVRRNANESYTVLTPRQQIASSPYSIRTLSAQQADMSLDSQKLGGVAASEYVTNTTVGNSFIRNSTALQTANFTISGNGFIGGSIGLGASVDPNFRLNSFGGIRSFSSTAAHFVAETNGGTNSWARFYMRSTNRSWFIGTSQNFNSDQFYLVDETAGQTRMAITTGGLVGFGTTNPQSGIELRGTGFQAQQRITDNTSGNSLVIQSGAGNSMKVTGYNYGTSQAVPLYLSTDGANTILNNGGGNVLQPGAGYGMPKAMVFVLANGTISRCYNGITGATTNGCGFTATRNTQTGVPVYSVNFGFDVSNRFCSLTSVGGANISGRIRIIGGTSVYAAFFQAGNTTSNDDSDFFLIVY